MPHPAFALFTAVLLAAALALLEDRPAAARLRVAARTFLTCAAVVFAGSWLMYAIHTLG
jgi:hypothetical protein